MCCKFDKELLYAFDDKTIEPLEKIFIEEHIKYCTDCQKDLKLITIINENIKDELSHIEFPDKLSIISQLVAENCISEMDNISIRMKVHNIIVTYKGIHNVITESSEAYKNNPYNNFISNRIDATFNYIKTPVKHMIKNKINEMSIVKKLKLKVG
ncbi:zf-HC2 domain-containing protein [Clostridium sp. CM028]|uniref:zf-HC2 domain-containing protein n=1 Tax=unclassified Clostridium TaxID=2614128 RepID=UPI001C0C55D0|nr:MULTISPECIES: zf-HC2 domain-containing protein [unclassified Clostridium]MBU3093353.1 zf-HC2 domain-containing protein [Clostridium sp. CF011]MBW9146738.1 zf-HC2 domain-containing protein [Clostridium sp. CM027]MBW9148121.1 zf-HC2 domain-containing protein [Clostridium sp. CM028]UVE41602.1 zf-HC2 domain-containing protein [Clostridium sp. CM027]WAG70595.1 zf-HC2 domain-containing protein [Clostridium sp. CF011]